MHGAFPFPTSYFRTDAGRLAYTDTGEGQPIVCLHGNPTWAFMYRYLLRDLSNTYRCIAPDYLGFGRSDKPADASYRPPDQATRIEAFLEHLELEPITLVVHDWGGPIGLSYALRHPERVARLVILNSWLWPHNMDPWVASFSRIVGGPIGRTLIRRFNAFAELGLRLGTTRPLSMNVLQAYTSPLDTPERRMPSWIFPKALLAETDWLRSMWTHRNRLRNMDAIIIWGRRDPAFGSTHYLERWRHLLPNAHVLQTGASHYVAEDLGPRLGDILLRHLSTPP